jgi:hypothetical protein
VANTTATDARIRQMEEEVEEKQAFINTLSATAGEANEHRGRDFTSQEMEMITAAQTRIDTITAQLAPMRAAHKAAIESRAKLEQYDAEMTQFRRNVPATGNLEYRSAGEYIADLYAGQMGDRDALERIELFNRAAAHQTTADNAGLLPVRVVEPVLNGVDTARPLVAAFGTTDLGPGSWAYPKVTQHTQVAAQSAEKAELASRKMLVTMTNITAPTYGGYVNVSRQNIRRSQPGIVDLIIADLAGQYAIATEDALGDALVAAGSASDVDLPNAAGLAGAGGPYGVSSAVWGAAGQSAAALRTANIPATGPILIVSPDQLAILAPIFPPVNPGNAQGTGFSAVNAAVQGPQGTASGITVVMGAGLNTGTVLFTYRSNVRCYEDRYGALTVDEPSVMGMQVGYAGDFQTVILSNSAVIDIQQAA